MKTSFPRIPGNDLMFITGGKMTGQLVVGTRDGRNDGYLSDWLRSSVEELREKFPNYIGAVGMVYCFQVERASHVNQARGVA